MNGEKERSIDIRPNFFIVGAAKSGTTSLASYLDQHPDVFVCKPKEPNYFSLPPNATPTCIGPAPADMLFDLLLKYSVTGWESYQRLFADIGRAKAVGDASVRYLYTENSAERIANHYPEARIIVLLRHPVDRMYSHYHMNVHLHIEPAGFKEALDAEDQRVGEGWGWDWHYRRVSMYADQLDRYFQHFERNQILVLDYNDFKEKPQEVASVVFAHLGVNTDFISDTSKKLFVGKSPKSRLIRSLVRDDNLLKRTAQAVIPTHTRRLVADWLERKNSSTIPPINPRLYSRLTRWFDDQKERLEDMLRRKLQW